MKLALVTKPFPPEIDSVAMTLNHQVTVVRPRQNTDDRPWQDGFEADWLAVLARGENTPTIAVAALPP